MQLDLFLARRVTRVTAAAGVTKEHEICRAGKNSKEYAYKARAKRVVVGLNRILNPSILERLVKAAYISGSGGDDTMMQKRKRSGAGARARSPRDQIACAAKMNKLISLKLFSLGLVNLVRYKI